jgi:RNA polymerase sigma-70 factor (ECF subfamily)
MTVRDTLTTHADSPLREEAHLVDRAKAGDPQAFARLYDACVERITRYIYFRVSDESDMEDLVSQVFLKAWENLDRYKPGTSPFVAWLYRIARNLVIDHYRTRRTTLPLEEAAALPSDISMPDDEAQLRFDLEAMRDGLQALSADQQQALILKYIAGLPNDSIARIMNKQEGTVRGLQMRGLQTLAKYMKERELL